VQYEYTIIAVNPPGIASIPAAVLLRSVSDDRVRAKVRDDLGLVLDRDSAEVLIGNVTLFTKRASVVGGAALLAELEDSLSNFLTIGPRSTIVDAGDPDTLLGALLSEHCSLRA
jgi:hypothetical protein